MVARNVKLVEDMAMEVKKDVNISDMEGRCTYRYSVAVSELELEDVEVDVSVRP